MANVKSKCMSVFLSITTYYQRSKGYTKQFIVIREMGVEYKSPTFDLYCKLHTTLLFRNTARILMFSFAVMYTNSLQPKVNNYGYFHEAQYQPQRSDIKQQNNKQYHCAFHEILLRGL